MTELRVPRFTTEKIGGLFDQPKPKKNPHLLFYRYLQAKDSEKNLELLKKHFPGHADIGMIEALHNRQEAALDQWRTLYGQDSVCSARMSLVDRMMVGIGISNGFENGLLLHWVHGIPFINGEAVKGATRGLAFETLDQGNEAEADIFRRIFGTIKKEEKDAKAMQRGEVVFFDAYPVNHANLFEIDVVTCHYQPYYMGEGNQEPGDWYMPKPVPFLAVGADTVFEFAVASQTPELADQAFHWLCEALVRRGMGARKRIGYGHFARTANMKNKDQATDNKPEPQTENKTELKNLLEYLQNIQSNRIPSEASGLLERIEAIEETRLRIEAAQKLFNQVGPGMYKKHKNQSWMKKLKALREEQPS